MAVTVAQLAKIETSPLKKSIIMNLLREVTLWEWLPFENVEALTNIAIRWQTLPSVAFRQINAGYTASEGDTEQVTESVYGFGGDIKFDRVFEKVKNVVRPMKQLQMEMKLKAMALTWNDYLINGDHATDNLGFEGLKKRVAGMPSRQSVYFAGAAAAALDPTASVANGRAFFDKLEEMWKYTAGNVAAYLMNEGMYLGVGKVARYIQASGGNFLDVTQDSFGRDITTYRGAPLIDVGVKKDQSTEIITDAETAGDAGTDASSIYTVSFDPTDGITGIQLSDMDIYDPLNGGEQESTPTKLMRIDWWNGLASYGSHGIVRGRNVEGASNWT